MPDASEEIFRGTSLPLIVVHAIIANATNSARVLKICSVHHLSRRTIQLSGMVLAVHISISFWIGRFPKRDIIMHEKRNVDAADNAKKTGLFCRCRAAEISVNKVPRITIVTISA